MDNQCVKKTFVAINLIRIIIQLLHKKRKISKKILGSANVIAAKIKIILVIFFSLSKTMMTNSFSNLLE